MELSGAQQAWISTFGEHPPLRQSPQFKKTWVLFRDVGFDELCDTLRLYGNREVWEQNTRGKPVEIHTGTVAGPSVDRCGGPYWNMTAESSQRMLPNGKPGVQYKCCLHMFEGD